MLKLALAASTLLALAALIVLIGVLGLWMKGIGSIAFPGLGVIVGTKAFLIALSIAELSLVFIAAYEAARAEGRTLLVLDTEQGSFAERLYERCGYARSGVIPQFALNAEGSLITTVVFYKLI